MILTLVQKITRIVRKEKNKVSQIYGYTPPQLMVLKYVWQNQQVTMSDISNEIGLGNSTTSGIIDRMVSQEMLIRTRSESDRRIIHIELTEKAKALAGKMCLNHEVFYQNLFSKLTSSDKEQMAAFLEKLYSILSETLIDDVNEK